MANKKISQLDVGSTPADSDLLLIITDPTNTKVAKKCTYANFIKALFQYSGVPLGSRRLLSGFAEPGTLAGLYGDLYSDKDGGCFWQCNDQTPPCGWRVVGSE